VPLLYSKLYCSDYISKKSEAVFGTISIFLLVEEPSADLKFV
jgi:hypothetical protein